MHNFKRLGGVRFPAYSGVSANMLPFVMGDHESIPEEYRQYAPLVDACNLPASELGKVGYLTVTESVVLGGRSQRRGGIHVEKHPPVTELLLSEMPKYDFSAFGGGSSSFGGGTPPPAPAPFGGGGSFGAGNQLRGWGGGGGTSWGGRGGGLYMASTVGDSCRVWDHYVHVPGDQGSVEHLRDTFGPGETMAANELLWMHDGCPHEALPLPDGTQRQFFRLVTSEVGVWYSKHSTANRLGVLPGARIVETSKF
jgi:hypothetical protein